MMDTNEKKLKMLLSQRNLLFIYFWNFHSLDFKNRVNLNQTRLIYFDAVEIHPAAGTLLAGCAPNADVVHLGDLDLELIGATRIVDEVRARSTRNDPRIVACGHVCRVRFAQALARPCAHSRLRLSLPQS